jgi:hypothetical protein
MLYKQWNSKLCDVFYKNVIIYTEISVELFLETIMMYVGRRSMPEVPSEGFIDNR